MRRLWLVGLLVVTGCAEAPPVDATVPVLTLKRHEGETPEKQGVAMAAEAITPDSSSQAPMMRLTWQEIDRSAPAAMGSGIGASSQMITRHATVSLVPMPSFTVRIVNHSQQPIDFAKAKIAVIDSTGKRFASFADAGSIAGRVENDITDRYAALSQKQDSMASLRDAIAKLPWLDSKVVVQPGGEWQGLIAVDLGVHDLAEISHYLEKVNKLTLEIAGIGDGSAPLTLDATFDRAKIAMAMSCPQGKPPSVDLCKPKP